jgi:hypothetical protein
MAWAAWGGDERLPEEQQRGCKTYPGSIADRAKHGHSNLENFAGTQPGLCAGIFQSMRPIPLLG